MSKNISIDDLADEVMKGLREYADVATSDLKKAVRKAGKTVRQEIRDNAPQRTGEYAESWSTEKIKEDANSLQLVVRSKKRYYLAHLLEHGHAKRGGGRVAGKAHIALAEKKGEEVLDKALKKALKG